MKAITLNKANFGDCEFGVSPLKTINSKANPGEKYSFYWVLIYHPDGEVQYCATCAPLTKVMGEDCDDDKFCDTVLPSIAGQYEIAPLVDKESGVPATFEDETPIYCFRKRAHRKAAAW
jgi:hypothetical protein